ncbi:ABC polyamine/opine transporter, inner membrane subunit [Oceanicola granulosus HTCC2516]|uniref:ABC polyamine/opine transporter, inner membrane subunit n=1 Tax=Oceanicola granulosus (strain ATCC BAA-861 / DSM 15982 / KCTC 12143 / HTCC2516) TaxID=314256 RepID=Q2CCB3_OCEGH|nr:ABC transporter permease [Oceanicola granulosus]EAR50320.1 ABC polyamine/opine transporter, inner membrane subunit [Oceanicola granulosus HTCC2516]
MTDATAQDKIAGPTPDTAIRDAERADGPMLAADGRPLKKSLASALRRQKIRALLLIAPLLIFIMFTFIIPIGQMLFRSVENQIVSETLPRTVAALDGYDSESGPPSGEVFAALTRDMVVAAELKNHTRLGSRLNYETTGLSSLFRQAGRGVDDIGEDYTDAFVDANEAWEEGETWVRLLANEGWIVASDEWAAREEAAGRGFDELPPRFVFADGVEEALPRTTEMYADFAAVLRTEDGDSPVDEEPWNIVYLSLYEDLAANPDAPAAFEGAEAELLAEAAEIAAGLEPFDYTAAFEEIDEDWLGEDVWGTIDAFSSDYTAGYFAASADRKLTPDGIQPVDEDQRVYGTLFLRTMLMSLGITVSCIALGYPVAWLLANLPLRTANVLMILVLLPFWTSLLVRTSAWKVLLQQQGVINDILVWLGLVSDSNRLIMINNQFGTIVAMTHILLPFMILPLYSVMKTIPPSYLRAAKSLGATNWTAFWRVYFPQSVPGIGAGSILVFILAIGYYITPEIVGGTKGVFISNRIAYHISTSLNWGLAAALGTILLALVLVLYWLYDRIVGIDNVKLGG